MRRQIQGHALVDRRITRSITKLWDGPLSPVDLDLIEMGLRALLVSNKLSIPRVFSTWNSGFHQTQAFPDDEDVEEPFGDHILDYEFEDPYSIVPQAPLQSDEAGYLERVVSENLSEMAKTILPKWIEFDGQALEYLDAWYEGCDHKECEVRARAMMKWDDFLQKYPSDQFTHAVFHKGPEGDAKYIVSIYRAGVDIYAVSPIAKLSKDFIFSEWPNKVFESFESDYQTIMREIRGPACAIDLPPLTALVLSRAANRVQIPETIRDIRDEYEKDRKQLWGVLSNMWEANSIREQLEIFRSISDPSKNIFRAAFPERYDALSIGLVFAKLSPSGIVSGLKKLKEHDTPHARVKALSFAYKLSKDFRRHLLSSRILLKRHLTLSEYHDFGLA